MKRVVLVLFCLFLVGSSACTNTETTKMKVVTSTTLMEYIVRQVAGNRLDITNLVPPNQHPGNFDLKPSDIAQVASARLLLLHGLPGEGWADKMIASANNPNLIVKRTSVPGNWMIPSIQIAATDKVTSILSETDIEDAAIYQKAAEEYKKRVQAKENDIKARLVKAGVSKTNVIASVRQADFLQWAGYNVVSTFVGPQSLTPQVIKELVDQGKTAGVSLVINNLQDGQDAGKAIATELGAKNLNLSNFPGGFENTATWEKAIDRNVDILLAASK